MPASGRASVTTTAVIDAGICVLTIDGVLDSTTYLGLRNTIIKAALDQPRGVIADITGLMVPAESALAVFTSARWHVGRWPDVPLMMVCRHVAGRESLARNGIARYAPVFESTESAMGQLLRGARSGRRRARAELTPGPASIPYAWDFAAECLTYWSQLDLLPAVKIVVRALLENVFAHTEGGANLRLESNGEWVTVAVDDISTALASPHDGAWADQLSSLTIVDAVCRMWGNAPTTTGKTVWAVLGPECRR